MAKESCGAKIETKKSAKSPFNKNSVNQLAIPP